MIKLVNSSANVMTSDLSFPLYRLPNECRLLIDFRGNSRLIDTRAPMGEENVRSGQSCFNPSKAVWWERDVGIKRVHTTNCLSSKEALPDLANHGV